MGNFAEVTITYSGGKVECNPDTVQLHYSRPEGPDSVRWLLSSSTERMTVEFGWTPECPFARMTDDYGQRRIEGTENKKVAGEYKYTVTLKDSQGRPVAVQDPRIQNGN